jgi:protein involved in polysaccharide export with SLBB domain
MPSSNFRLFAYFYLFSGLLPCFGAMAAEPPPLEVLEESLHAGDQLSILIPSEGEPRRVEIDADGRVDLGRYGRVVVQGLSPSGAQTIIRTHLQDYFRSVKGIRVVRQKSGRLVQVSGLVKRPGNITLNQRMGVWDALMAAGGPAPGADLQRIEVRRGSEVILINVHGLLLGVERMAALWLQPSDVVFVPAAAGYSPVVGEDDPREKAGGLADKVLIMGEVRYPGTYRRPFPFDPWATLSLAGGPEREADLTSIRVRIGNKTQVLNLRASLSPSADLEDFEGKGPVTIFVPSRTRLEKKGLVKTIQVLGGVESPGAHPVSGSITLLDALSAAGGTSEKGDMTQVQLIQRRDGVHITTTYDLKNRLALASSAVLVQPGDTVVVGFLRDSPLAIALTALSQLAVVAGVITLVVSLAGAGN